MSGKKKILFALGLIFSVVCLSVYLSVLSRQKVIYGVTFSQKFAEELGLDWQKLYIDILDDLKVRDLRLIAYWDKVEPEEGDFDFRDLDWQVAEAQNRGAKIILALGKKTPRWPECHMPAWANKLWMSDVHSLTMDVGHLKYQEAILAYLKNTVERYKTNPSIIAWQVENEPLFPFGECGMVGIGLLNKEIELVRSLDGRPILLTDAGEMGFAWPYLAAKSDIFGTTLYRYVHNRILGDIKYTLIPPAYFRLKAWWANKILGREILISELQAEPWSQVSLSQTSFEDQAKSMSPDKLKEITDYAERSGFPKAYFWGVEWWYWLREKKNMPEMWDAAKQIITNSNARE